MDPFDFDDLTQPRQEPAPADEPAATTAKPVMNLDWRIPFAVLSGLFLLVLVIQAWSALTTSSLRTSRLELIDASGKIRGVLGMEDNSPSLTLFDELGNKRASLTVIAEGPRLFLYDENENWRVMMATSPQGPGLGLRDADGKILHSAP